ncbi:MAG: DUF3857 domain-containing protein, partial [Hymenobacter sp.]
DNDYTGSFIIRGYGPSCLLTDGVQQRTFVKQSLSSIINQVLQPYRANLLPRALNLTSQAPLPYVVQYNESNFDFLNRLLAECHEWFYYDGTTLHFGLAADAPTVALELHKQWSSFQLESERVTRIKILKKSGYEVATVEVPLYHQDLKDEKIVGLRGFTYNEVGGKIEKVKLETGQAFTEERTKNLKVRKFTLPGVREGAVIEYAYTVTSDFLFNFQGWTFQREIPTRWSEFKAEIPEYFDYKMLMQGYVPLTLQTQVTNQAQYTLHTSASIEPGMQGGREAASNETFTAQATNYHWAMKNVPALRDEPYMTTTRDYVARINFELAGQRMPGGGYQNVAGSWEKINADLLASTEFGGQLGRLGFLEAALKPLMAQYSDPAARAAAVRELIIKSVKYDGTNRYSASGALKKSYELHRGTSADVNLLLIAALRQVGLAAQPVILSTRTHGRVNQAFPLLEQFNYVIGVLPLAD